MLKINVSSAKRKRLEAAGWKVGDAADFLEISAEERQLLDARVELALAIRRQRESAHLSQKELGARLKTSQPRVARIERAATDVSLDQLVRAFTAAGGKIVVKSTTKKPKNGKHAKSAGTGTVVFEVATSKIVCGRRGLRNLFGRSGGGTICPRFPIYLKQPRANSLC